jgi:hypothetical protein
MRSHIRVRLVAQQEWYQVVAETEGFEIARRRTELIETAATQAF